MATEDQFEPLHLGEVVDETPGEDPEFEQVKNSLDEARAAVNEHRERGRALLANLHRAQDSFAELAERRHNERLQAQAQSHNE